MPAPTSIETRLQRMEEELAASKAQAAADKVVADRKIAQLEGRDNPEVTVKKTPQPRPKVRKFIASTPEFGVMFCATKGRHADRKVILITSKRLDLGNGMYRDARPLEMEFRELPDGIGSDLPYTILVASIWNNSDIKITDEDLKRYPNIPKGVQARPVGDYTVPEVATAMEMVFGIALKRFITNPSDPWPEFMDGEFFRRFCDVKYKNEWEKEDSRKREIEARDSGDYYSLKSGNAAPVAERDLVGASI